MKPTILFLPILSLFITLLLFFIYQIDDYEVRKGSSLSSSYSPKKDRTYWLSPSGNFAFGFYPLCTDCDDPRYVVGIWLVKTEYKTLVWVAYPNDPPLNNLSSIFFDGKFILETKTRKKGNQISGVEHRDLLPQVSVSAAYARLNDNGNFVLYNYDSEIIWESFDHPTNTILGGQQLSTGQRLVSEYGSSNLGFENNYGNIQIFYGETRRYTSAKSFWHSEVVIQPATLKLDATDGRLYLVDGNNVLLQNITQADEHKCEHDTIIYRGTLDRDGIFRLYKERMLGSQGAKSIILWDSRLSGDHDSFMFTTHVLLISLILFCFMVTYFCPNNPVEKRKVGSAAKKNRRHLGTHS